MAIYANNVIRDALSLIDVTAPGEDPEAYWIQLGVRLLNGLLSEWSLKGLYNPDYTFTQLVSAEAKNYYTLGIDDSVTLSSSTKYSIVATLSSTGTYYLSVTDGIQKYSTVGSGSTYTLTVTEDTAGTFYAIAGGYTQLATGDIPVNYSNISKVQVDLGQVVYNPTQISMGEYQAISVKMTQAAPAVWAYDYQQPIGKLYFYPRLLPNMTIRIVGQPTLDQIASNTSNIPIDRMYYTALLYCLATKLYPFLKRDGGIDQEIVYQAKTAVSGLRVRVMDMISSQVRCPYGESIPQNEYFNSPLNTVTGTGN